MLNSCLTRSGEGAKAARQECRLHMQMVGALWLEGTVRVREGVSLIDAHRRLGGRTADLPTCMSAKKGYVILVPTDTGPERVI